MANRGALGGLSEAALQAALLLDAAGREDVFVETVGVGQAEIDIIDHADTIVLVLMPGSGDSIQALKAGVMEIPDVIVINKADHPLTDTMVREIRGVLSLANLDRSPEEVRGQLARADRQDRGRPRQGRRRAGRAPGRAPRAHPRRGPAGRAPRGATCATRCSRSPPRACAGAWRRSCARTPSSSGCSTRSSQRRLDPASAADGAARARALAQPREPSSRLGRAMDYLSLADRNWPLLRRLMGGHTAVYRASQRPDRASLPGLAADAAARPRRRQERHAAHEPARLRRATARTSMLVASKGGYPKNPAWFHNLLRQPRHDASRSARSAQRRARARGRGRGARRACGR